MIDEEKQDQIIAQILGVLDPAAQGEVAAELSANAELAQFADELREATAALAHAVPLHRPPPQLRARVLAAATGETTSAHMIAPRPVSRQTRRLPDWLPWAVAAGIALGAIVQFVATENIRSEVARLSVEAAASNREAAELRELKEKLAAEAKALEARTAQLQEALDGWKKRDALSEVRIASLTAQVSALSKAGAIIVWDAEQQRGIVKLSNLPRAGAGKDYQLWVIDPKYPAPVSAGVLSVGGDGSGYVSFSPVQPITTPNKFAISVERAGGAPAPAGQIVFLGD